MAYRLRPAFPATHQLRRGHGSWIIFVPNGERDRTTVDFVYELLQHTIDDRHTLLRFIQQAENEYKTQIFARGVYENKEQEDRKTIEPKPRGGYTSKPRRGSGGRVDNDY